MYSPFDLAFAVLAAFLVTKGIWKGFVKEVAGILALLLGLLLAKLYHEEAAQLLGTMMNQNYVEISAYAVVFALTYIVVMLAGKVLEKVLKTLFLGGINRILGGVFGLVKTLAWGILFVLVYTTLRATTGMAHPSWIESSLAFPYLVDASNIAKHLI